jgi:hypothetical protein
MVSLFAAFNGESDEICGTEEIVYSLREKIEAIRPGLNITELYGLNNSGKIDMTKCYNAKSSYDVYVMAHLYQVLVRDCISSYHKQPDFNPEEANPELFFNGPLFHSIYQMITQILSNEATEQEDEELMEQKKLEEEERRTSAEFYRNAVLEKLNSDRVLFISGQTGCGKVNSCFYINCVRLL